MKFIDYTKERMRGISDAVVRYFTVFILLVATAVVNGIAISADHDMERHIVALVFGVFCFLLGHALGERFGKTTAGKSLYLAAALVVTVAYYIYIMKVSNIGDVVMIRTITLIFALFFAFIWVPSVKSNTDFNAVFLSVFKAFFTSVFFSGIIFGGICLIIAAVDNLLFHVDSDAYAHTANAVWIVWAPMLMLSLIPVFTGSFANNAKLEKATGYPRFLDLLLTYVLIPLASVYTLVLVIYMGKTVALTDWSDNLLEPMLLTYLIAVILIYVLVKRLGNAPSKFFVRIFPALIAVIAAFQFAASLIKATEEGIVASRYYVLAFSIYSVIIGVLLFLFPKRRNGYVAAIAVVFALVCAAPAFGAFDVSIRDQSARVESTLEKNGMLKNGVLTPNANLSDEDKNSIRKGIEYLNGIDALGSLGFLPENFEMYPDFERVLGYDPYGNGINKTTKTYMINEGVPVDSSGYDYLSSASIYLPLGKNDNVVNMTVTRGGQDYSLRLTGEDNGTTVTLYRGNSKLLEAPVSSMTETINGYSYENGILDPDKMTFDIENDSAKIRIVFRSISIYSGGEETNVDADTLILFSIK